MQKLINTWILFIAISFTILGQVGVVDADRLIAEGQTDLAIKESLRAYVYDKSANNILLYEVALTCQKDGRNREAINFFDQYYFTLPVGSPLRNEIHYEKAKILISEKSLMRAKAEVFQVVPDDTPSRDRQLFYLVLIEYLSLDTLAARSALQQLSYYGEIDKDLMQKLSHKLYAVKPFRYQLASGMLPGLGQMLAGDFADGSKSMALNGLLVYTLIRVGTSLSYADAALTVAPWLAKYFIGGVGNARKAALQKKERKTMECVQQLMTEIEKGKLRSQN